MNRFYLTTAIDFVNSRPHLGTAYEKIAADVIARYKRLCGVETRFLMGNDEHSQNVFKKAAEEGLDPLAYCDQMEQEFRRTWKRLDVSFDDFIRTTEPRHKAGVTALIAANFRRRRRHLRGRLRGLVLCRLRGVQAGKGPRRRQVSPASDDSRSGSAKRISSSGFRSTSSRSSNISPAIRSSCSPRSGATRFCVCSREGSKTSPSAAPASRGAFRCRSIPTSVVYVWFDALINYASAVGLGEDPALFAKWWPADLHIIGKDITRFHTVIWPAMLMSAKLPLPRQVFGHGFMTFGGQRMSKSLGTAIDPIEAADRFGPDPLRLFLTKEIAFGGDGDFSWERYDERYNTDLANNLGNLVSRVTTMAHRYREGELAPATGPLGSAGAARRAGRRPTTGARWTRSRFTRARRRPTASSTRPTSSSPRRRRGRWPRIRPSAESFVAGAVRLGGGHPPVGGPACRPFMPASSQRNPATRRRAPTDALQFRPRRPLAGRRRARRSRSTDRSGRVRSTTTVTDDPRHPALYLARRHADTAPGTSRTRHPRHLARHRHRGTRHRGTRIASPSTTS